MPESMRPWLPFEWPSQFEYLLQPLVTPDVTELFCVPGHTTPEYQRTMGDGSRPETGSKPLRNPSVKRLSSLVHPQKNVVSFEPLGNVKQTNVGDS
jgi:hypothetical protein